jgi:Co/Zn/Cd efflux system component
MAGNHNHPHFGHSHSPEIQDVTRVDPIHVWSIRTTENALTAHVLLSKELSFEE